MRGPQIRLIYEESDMGGTTYVNVSPISTSIAFPEAIKRSLDDVTKGLLRNLAFDLIPADDKYEKTLRDKFDEIGKVIR